MSWVKIDDRITEHPKFVGLTDAAVALWMRGLVHASRYRTDGILERTVVRRLGPRKVVKELLHARLWEAGRAGDVVIHDYLKYQPAADAQLRLGQIRAEAGGKGAEKRWQKADDDEGKPDSKLPSQNRQSASSVPPPDLPSTRDPEKDKSKLQRKMQPIRPIFAALRAALPPKDPT